MTENMIYNISILGSYFAVLLMAAYLGYSLIRKKYSFFKVKPFISYFSIVLSFVLFFSFFFSLEIYFLLYTRLIPYFIGIYLLFLILEFALSFYKGTKFMNTETKFSLTAFSCLVLIWILSGFVFDDAMIENLKIIGNMSYKVLILAACSVVLFIPAYLVYVAAKRKYYFFRTKFLVLYFLIVLSGIIVFYVLDFVAGIDRGKIKEKFGEICDIRETCGDMMFVDCGMEVDGPAYYVDKNLNIIGHSGGFCFGQKCSGPPKEWLSCKQ